LEREYRFDLDRKWRFDFAHPASMTAIELEGGVWTGGAHNRGRHFLSDCEKYNTAALLGWTVFRLGTGMVRVPALEQIKRHIDDHLWETISVGSYCMMIHENGTGMVVNEIGEAMQTSKARLEQMVREFFNQEF
jgi:hypothetical protein